MVDADDLDALLIQSAQINAKIRKRLLDADRPSNSKLFTYALLLQNNNIYVGSTNNIYLRLNQHVHDLDYSSKWVRLHGPVVRVLEVIRNSSTEDEVYKTLEYMTLFGYQSVRGAHWTTVEMRGPPASLPTFTRSRNDFDYLSRPEIDRALHVAQELYEIIQSTTM